MSTQPPEDIDRPEHPGADTTSAQATDVQVTGEPEAGTSVATVAPATGPQAQATTDGFVLVTSIYVLVGVAWSLYVPELFPTVIRMRGAGFCNTLGRFFTILTPQITTFLFGVGGVTSVVSYVVFWLLLQFSRALRTLRHASARPVGSVAGAVALHAKLERGMRLPQILKLTGSLGRTAGNNAGTYAINVGTLSAGGNYTISYTGATVTREMKWLRT